MGRFSADWEARINLTKAGFPTTNDQSHALCFPLHERLESIFRDTVEQFSTGDGKKM
jgi:hypothetical protein